VSVADWKDVVGAVAPGLATALGGPLAGAAVAALSAKLLGREDGTEADVAAAVTAGGPDALLAIRQADQVFATRMRELDIDVEKLHQADRADARMRELSGNDAWTPRLLAAVVLLGWFAVQGFLLTNVVPAEMREIVLRAMGTLDMALGLVLSYYFGSSSSSRVKDDVISKASVLGTKMR
jgi:hypothetical protein